MTDSRTQWAAEILVRGIARILAAETVLPPPSGSSMEQPRHGSTGPRSQQLKALDGVPLQSVHVTGLSQERLST